MTLVDRMAKDLLIEKQIIQKIVRSASHRYKQYFIPKKDGSLREILHPARELKILQRWVNQRILRQLPVSSAAAAYETGTSILKNAQFHQQHSYLLRIDFTNFFGSISASDVDLLLRRHSRGKLKGLITSEADRKMLVKIICRNEKTVIGAPTSPLVANRVMYPIDLKIQKQAATLGVTYSRYADDLFFSTSEKHVLQKMTSAVEGILMRARSPKLAINRQKTRYSSKKWKRSVTGVVITDEEKLSLGREKKRWIRTSVYKAVKGEVPPDRLSSLSGTIAQAFSIEPDFVTRLLEHYSIEDLRRAGLIIPPRYIRRTKRQKLKEKQDGSIQW